MWYSKSIFQFSLLFSPLILISGFFTFLTLLEMEDISSVNRMKLLVSLCIGLVMIFLRPLQARILGLNASYYLKAGGHFVISIKVCYVHYIGLSSQY